MKRILYILTLFAAVTAQAQVVRQPTGAIVWLSYEDGAALNRVSTNTVTASGAITFTPSRSGSGVTYGAAGYHTANNTFVTNNVFTVAAWMYMTSFSAASSSIAGQRAGASCTLDFVFAVNPSGYLILYGNSCVNRLSNDFIFLNQWWHVAVVSSAAGVRFFINGVHDGGGAAMTIAGSNQPLQIGNGGGTSTTAYFLNKLDEVRVYNRALSDAEIASLANSRRPSP